MPTEVMFVGLSGVVWLRLLFAVAVAVFVWRMAVLAGILRQGRGENRWDRPGLRTWVFLSEVIGQRRMFREPVIGWAHPAIFWGFCLFVIASTLMLLGGMFPGLPIPQAERIPVLGTAVDLFAILVLVGLGAAAVRRYGFTPAGLQRTWDASLILVLIAVLMVTFLLVEAGGHGTERQTWLPAGTVTAQLLATMNVPGTAVRAMGHAAWWVHVLVLLGFLAYLPFSKHMHLLWAPLAVFAAELPDKGNLPPADDVSGTPETPLRQFTWRMLLSAYACAECGRCERVCPATASGAQLSPRDVVHRLKEYVFAHGLAGDSKPAGNGDDRLETHIPPAMVWGCTTCYACMDVCPVRNEHVPLLVELRRRLVERGTIDPKLQETLTALQRYGNSLGKSSRKRFEWTKDLPEPLVDCRQQPVDMLWFLGDYASYHPSSARVSRLVAQVFQRAGADFGVLPKGEKNAGNDVRRVGEEGLFEMLAEQNIKALEQAQFRRIVTTDPHTYHALKHDYRRFGLESPVVHYSEVLDEWLADGTLQPVRRLSGRAVYHDPCYLGRINGIYEPPRRVLDALGLERLEMPRSRGDSFCCGAGGGKLWMEEEPGLTERPAVLRIREALAVDGATHFVVACPKDLGMFEDAVKTVGAEDRLQVVDLGELVFEAVSAAPSNV